MINAVRTPEQYFMRVTKSNKAIAISKNILKLNDSKLKNQNDRVISLIKLGSLEESNEILNKMVQMFTNQMILTKVAKYLIILGEKFQSQGAIHYIDAISSFTKAIILEGSTNVYLKRAQLLLLMGKFEEAKEDVDKAIDIDKTHVESRRLRFKILEESQTELTELIKEASTIYNMEPDEYTKEKLGYLYFSQGLEESNRKDFINSFKSLSKAINYIPESGFVYKERAFVTYNLQNLSVALKDCSEAIKLKFDSEDIRMLRANCLLKLHRMSEAHKDATVAYDMNPSYKYFIFLVEVESMCPRSTNFVRKSKIEKEQSCESNSESKTYYDFLGLNPSASSEEIRKQFLLLSLKYHPDKIRNVSKKKKLEFLDKFKAILECYNILSNTYSKKIYDDDLIN